MVMPSAKAFMCAVAILLLMPLILLGVLAAVVFDSVNLGWHYGMSLMERFAKVVENRNRL
jgi:hypothetical protein